MSGNTKYNTDLATRQMQINEWSYHNKMETLFVFQLIFLTLSLFAVLMYMNKANYINVYFMGFIMIIVVFIIAIIIFNRVSYTAKVRDTRFWNRRQFGYMEAIEPSKGSAEFLTQARAQAQNS
jgi:hypothetical protein